MPIIKSAKKKVRQDKKRNLVNKKYEAAYKKIVNDFKHGKNVGKNAVNQLYSKIDKAVKKNVIHKKKASRLKSGLSKLLKRNKTTSK